MVILGLARWGAKRGVVGEALLGRKRVAIDLKTSLFTTCFSWKIAILYTSSALVLTCFLKRTLVLE